MRYFLMLMLFGVIGVANVGCEAEGRIDDDNGKIEVDVDD